MKIVAVDNFGRETVADRLVAENIQNEKEAVLMCGILNERLSGEGAQYWYRVFPDDRKLWRGMEELI